MKEKSPAFQWYPKEYLSDENVAYLTLEQEGAYTRLISYCWQEGSVPSDFKKMAQLCKGCDPAMLEPVAKLFEISENGERLTHKRLEEERQKQEQFRKERSSSGLRGAKKRWLSHGSAIAERMAVDGSASASASASASPPIVPQNGEVVFYELKKAMCKLFKRDESERLPYEDERLLAEVSRRPAASSEFQELLKYRNLPEAKPRQTWGSLLQNWQSELDKARGYDPKPSGNGITTYQQKQALLEEISRHPANRTFTGSVPNPTPLQTEDLKEKRERLKALNTLIAKGGVNG